MTTPQEMYMVKRDKRAELAKALEFVVYLFPSEPLGLKFEPDTLKVASIDPHGQAERSKAGIVRGDRLIKVGPSRVSNPTDLRYAISRSFYWTGPKVRHCVGAPRAHIINAQKPVNCHILRAHSHSHSFTGVRAVTEPHRAHLCFGRSDRACHRTGELRLQ